MQRPRRVPRDELAGPFAQRPVDLELEDRAHEVSAGKVRNRLECGIFFLYYGLHSNRDVSLYELRYVSDTTHHKSDKDLHNTNHLVVKMQKYLK